MKTSNIYHADACLLLALAVIRRAARDRRAHQRLQHYDARWFFRDCRDWIDWVIDLAEATNAMRRGKLIL